MSLKKATALLQSKRRLPAGNHRDWSRLLFDAPSLGLSQHLAGPFPVPIRKWPNELALKAYREVKIIHGGDPHAMGRFATALHVIAQALRTTRQPS